MKFKAFGKINGKYVTENSSDTHKYFFIWDVAELKKNNPDYFNKLSFYSIHSHESYRSELIPVIGGSKRLFFRYKSSSANSNNEDGDNETISHHLAILALSKLNKFNFVINDEKLTFHAEKIEYDCEQIKFENKKVYIPDLILEFSEDDPFYDKWGGRVALEVMVTHACPEQKKHDFKIHNLPIIEIKLTNKMQFEKFYKEVTHKNVEKYSEYLMEQFTNRIFGKIVSNPMQTDFAEDKINSLMNENEEITQIASEAELKYKKIKNINFNLQERIDELNIKLGQTNERLEEFNKLNILKKILRVIFYTPSA